MKTLKEEFYNYFKNKENHIFEIKELIDMNGITHTWISLKKYDFCFTSELDDNLNLKKFEDICSEEYLKNSTEDDVLFYNNFLNKYYKIMIPTIENFKIYFNLQNKLPVKNDKIKGLKI